MINRDEIEAGDKVYTRDGGCLVAIAGEDGVYVFNQLVQGLWYHDLSFTRLGQHPLDIIRIEKAPKPVVREIYVGTDSLAAYVTCEEYVPTFASVFKLTIINGKLEKSEQVK